jgi:hypothetical protein
MPKDKSRPSVLEYLGSLRRDKEQPQPVQQEVVAAEPEKPKKVSFAELQPAMPELGTTLCPECKRRVVVFVTKTKRPFINCGFCSARIFYNGSGAIRLLKRAIPSE